MPTLSGPFQRLQMAGTIHEQRDQLHCLRARLVLTRVEDVHHAGRRVTSVTPGLPGPSSGRQPGSRGLRVYDQCLEGSVRGRVATD